MTEMQIAQKNNGNFDDLIIRIAQLEEKINQIQNNSFEVALKAVQLSKEIQPRTSQVTQKLAAEMLHVSEQTVGKMVKSGRIKLNDCGMIPITEIDRVLSA